MDLFRLTFSTLLARKMWVVVLLAAVAMPRVFPYFTPHATKTSLPDPAAAGIAMKTIAGGFLVTLGAWAAFAFNAVTFFVYVLALALVRIDHRPAAPGPGRGGQSGRAHV